MFIIMISVIPAAGWMLADETLHHNIWGLTPRACTSGLTGASAADFFSYPGLPSMRKMISLTNQDGRIFFSSLKG